MKEKIIFKAIVGSQAYGTAIPTSDIDYKGIFIQPNEDILTFRYKEQIDKGKDECYYEVRRFLQLLKSANPTVLEMLYCPADCVLETSPVFELILSHRDKFLTKKCINSFGGYAVQQIKKAKGLDKKMNWEKDRVTRKTPLDFVYIYEDGKTIPIEKWLKAENKEQKFCGLVALNHFRDCYSIYYDYNEHYGKLTNRVYEPAGFHGIALDDSNSIRLSSVPKEMKPEGIVFYNKDGYSQHCKDFKEYSAWLELRNTQRFVDVKGHNQKIDGKNMLHCRRLLDMALEIAANKTLTVRRPNADYLLQIRRGEVDLQSLIDKAEEDIKGLDAAFNNSDLPDEVDNDFVNDLLLEIRLKPQPLL